MLAKAKINWQTSGLTPRSQHAEKSSGGNESEFGWQKQSDSYVGEKEWIASVGTWREARRWRGVVRQKPRESRLLQRKDLFWNGKYDRQTDQRTQNWEENLEQTNRLNKEAERWNNGAWVHSKG